MSFIGHSLGGLVIRSALIHLKNLKAKMNTLMTLGCPHLGCEINDSILVSIGFKVMRVFKSC